MVGLGLLSLWPITAQASWPPLQNVVAWAEGYDTHYKAYDSHSGQWLEGATLNRPALNSVVNVTDGVVVWDTGQVESFAVYDPGRCSWEVAYNWHTFGFCDRKWYSNRDGVVAWSTGIGDYFDALFEMWFATYDPVKGSWQMSYGPSSCPPFIGPTGDGIVVWWDGGAAFDYNTRYAIYDPQRGWVQDRGDSVSVSIDNATLTIDTGLSVITRGYDHNLGAWVNGPTVPYACFAASATTGIVPTNVWFTDMSIAATSWSRNWNFGDGAQSTARSPSHVYSTPGRYTASLTVSGPNGTSTTSRVVVFNAAVLYDYTVTNGTVTITKYNGFDDVVSIPSTISVSGVSLPVASIGSNAFYNCTSMTSVTIPSGVYNLGDYAFAACMNLTHVIIPESVTNIGARAFNNCSSLATVTIPDRVARIGNNAFRDCNNLTAVCFSGDAPKLGSTVFYGDAKTTVFYMSGRAGWVSPFGGRPLVAYTTNGDQATIVGYQGSCADVTIPGVLAESPVTSIGESAFGECDTLTRVTIPASVTNIDDWAFDYCGALTNVVMTNGLRRIGLGAFNMSGLTSVAIPASVTYLGPEAFDACQALTSVTLPASLTYIREGTFANCSSLTSLTLPNSITSIGDGAFFGAGLTSLLMGSGVTNIGDYAFSECNSIISFTIPNSVTTLGDAAFAACRNLANVTIPQSVTRIKGCPFANCSSLSAIAVGEPNVFYTSVNGVLFNEAQTELIQCPGAQAGDYTIPNGVTNVAYAAFQGCLNLNGVTVSGSVTYLSDEVFNDCIDLVAITVSAANPVYCSEDGILFNKNQTELIKCPDAKAGSYTIPGSVTSIGNNAFYDCWDLDSVVIGNNVTGIGHDAFRLCLGLNRFAIPDSVTNIGYGAFAVCQRLRNVTIGSGVTSIGDHMFELCNDLTDITIPNTVTNIGMAAFNWSGIENVTIGSGVTSIGLAAFESCYDLVNITIPASVTSIGRIAFSGCHSLTGVYFEGNAPNGGADLYMFSDSNDATVYYLQWTMGWGTTFGGRPTALWIQSVATGAATDISATTATLTGTVNPAGLTTSACFEYGLTDNYGSTVAVALAPDNGTNTQAVSASLTGLQPATTYHYRLVITNSQGSAYGDDATFATANTLTQGDYTATFANGQATITGFNVDYSGNLVITDSLGGCPVTGIGRAAFSGCANLTGVTFPSSVASIAINAFIACSGLTEVTIPRNVTSIAYGAFGECSRLTTIGVDTLNPSFVSVDGVLFNKNMTTLVQYPAGKSGCYTIPSSVTNVIPSAFYYCANLTSITIPNGVTKIQNWTFCGCSRLARMTFPSSVTSVGNAVFSDCTGLVDVTLPSSVTSIGNSAFSSCSSLTAVCFTGNAPSLGTTVFDGDTQATVYRVAGAAGWPTVPNTWGGRPTALWIPPVFTGGATNITPITVTLMGAANPGGIKTTAWFEYGLTDNYGSTVTVALAPDNGTNTQAVSASLAGLQPATTYHYRLVIANSQGSAYGDDATFTTSNTLIQGDYTFTVTNGQSTITDFNPNYVGPLSITNILCGYPVVEIATGAFQYAGEITSVTIPDSVCSLRGYAFRYCTNLASVVIGKAVRDIGTYAFSQCPSLTSVTIPDGVTNIAIRAFATCISLARVTIPASVIRIGDYAFRSSGNLSAVYFRGNAPSLGTTVFYSSPNVVSYRLAGATGWPAVPNTWANHPTALWVEPTVTTGAATNITSTTAVMTGTANPGGFATSAWFEYGLTTNYGSIASAALSPDNGTNTHTVGASLAGLLPTTVYHYRLAITNLQGSVFGNDAAFITAAAVTATPVPVPFAWVEQYPVLLSQAGGDYEAAALADADGDGYAAWQEYVAGSNPTNVASAFTAVMAVSNGVPRVAWTPDLGTVRVYTVEGRTNLTAGVWETTNSGSRFFRVKVGMP